MKWILQKNAKSSWMIMERKLQNPQQRTVKWQNSTGKSWTRPQPSWLNFVKTRGCQNESTVMRVLHNFHYWSSLQNCHFNCFNICRITILIAFRLHTSLESDFALIHITLSAGTGIWSSKICNKKLDKTTKSLILLLIIALYLSPLLLFLLGPRFEYLPKHSSCVRRFSWVKCK